LRSRRSLLFVMGILTGAMFPARAGAFKFQEHAAIGDEAIMAACKVRANELMKVLLVENNPGPEKFCLALFLPGRRTYGTVSAMSGDNIPSPYLFVDNLSRVEAVTASTTDYLLLAHENQEHFQPDSVATYRFWHRTAILSAFTIGRVMLDDPAALRRRLEEILIFNAFADHFLADSFSAGHIRVDRKRLSDRVSKNLHDFDNQQNVGKHAWSVMNSRGETWWPVGDGQWQAMDGADKARIVEAVSLSIDEVLTVFIDVVSAMQEGLPQDLAAKGLEPGTASLSALRNKSLIQRDDSYAALAVIPIRPQCAEQSMLGDQPCYGLTSYAESFIIGAAGNVHFTERANSTSWSIDLAKPLFSFFGFFLRADVHSDIRYDAPMNMTTGQGAWFTGGTVGVFGRVLPSPQASHGSEFSFAVKLGMPVLLAPSAGGWPHAYQKMAMYIPDVGFSVGRLFYSFDVNLEFGYGAFLSYGPPSVPGLPRTISAERGAQLGISTHFAIF